jgi:hypothetical protein
MNRMQKWLFLCAFIALNFCVYHHVNEWAAWKADMVRRLPAKGLHAEIEGRFDFAPLLIESTAIVAIFVSGFFFLKDPKKPQLNSN